MPKRLAQIIVPIALMAVVFAFQNCSYPSSDSFSSKASLATPSVPFAPIANNGQPYDGKPYVVPGLCADGTIVKSRLVLKGQAGSNGAILYRDDCKTDSSKSVKADEISIDPANGDVVKYAGKVFTAERPAIPLPGMISWYYQLQGPLTPKSPSGIYVIDMFDTTTTTIQNLKAAGHTVICVISAGTVENWRPDSNRFRTEDVGRTVSGTQDEKWLDTRSTSVRSVMLSRIDQAKNKGCHGINFDSVDGYDNASGFSLTRETQLEYNQYLAFAAHDRALILSLNNAPDLASDLSIQFDFAIAEQCFEFNECDKYSAFVNRNKPVLVTEYRSFSAAQCRQAEDLKLSLAFLSPKLDGSRFESCY